MSDLAVRNNTLGVVEELSAWLDHAIAFAERDLAETARARGINIERMIARGTCFVGHALDLPQIPINRLGTAPCGYCSSARAEMEA